VIIRCPNCNANLEVASTVTAATCSYCGAVSRIEPRKTAMFELPKDLAPTADERRQQLQQVQQLVPVRRASKALLVVPAVLVVMFATGFAVLARRGFTGSGRMLWGGHIPVLVDVDGDGVPDPIGIVRYVLANDRAHFAAYSGKTGKQLWETESLGSYGQLGQLQLAAAGSMLLVATDAGTLTARDAKARGVIKWTLSLGEKIDTMCRGGAEEVIVETADHKWFTIDARGNKRDAEPLLADRDYTSDDVLNKFVRGTGMCMRLGNAWRQPPNLIALQRWHDVANIPNMDVEMIVRDATGPTIALGHKQPGTRVPMLARLAPVKPFTPTARKPEPDLPGADWVTEIPATNPLTASFESQYFAMTDSLALVLYEQAHDEYRIAAFDLRTGKRVWDRVVGTSVAPVCLLVTGDVVLLSTWRNLTAFALADGAPRWDVGLRS